MYHSFCKKIGGSLHLQQYVNTYKHTLHLQLILKTLLGKHTLDNICSIQTVNAVGTKNSLLYRHHCSRRVCHKVSIQKKIASGHVPMRYHTSGLEWLTVFTKSLTPATTFFYTIVALLTIQGNQKQPTLKSTVHQSFAAVSITGMWSAQATYIH